MFRQVCCTCTGVNFCPIIRFNGRLFFIFLYNSDVAAFRAFMFDDVTCVAEFTLCMCNHVSDTPGLLL